MKRCFQLKTAQRAPPGLLSTYVWYNLDTPLGRADPRARTAELATSPVPLPSTQSVRALHHYNLYAPARSRTRAFECVRARSTAGRWFQSAARFRIGAAAAGSLRAPERWRAPRAAGRPAAAPPDRVSA